MKSLEEFRQELYKLASLNNIDTSDIDWLICYVLNLTRSEMLIKKEIEQKQINIINRLLKKRVRGIPLDQIIGKTDFYGFEFYVNKNCLIPRPETELLVETVIKNAKGEGLDIGTGSGAIAITLEKLAGLHMTALDVSVKALRIAKKNNKKLKTSVKFLHSDLFDKVRGRYDFIVSNPPYIKSDDILSLQVEVKSHEPRIALDGGKDGLDFYKKIIDNAPRFLKNNGKIFFELGINQSEDVKKLLEKDFSDITIIKDYNKIDRIIYATIREWYYDWKIKTN